MTVYLVGAGPGDPGLLTRRGAELLGQADVVVYDRLVERSLLELAPPGAVLVDVGKRPAAGEGMAPAPTAADPAGRPAGRPGTGGSVSAGTTRQHDINALLVEHGRGAGTVVRLKGGDPFLFGRGGEEAEALNAAGIDWEVVPGVTSAVAVPAAAGVPVTHRGLSTSVTVVTGHVGETTAPGAVDWESLGRAGGTLVVLMGMATRAEIARRLMDAGRAASTAVAVVQWGTTSEQRSVRTTLGELAEVPLGSPAVIVIGPVAGLALGRGTGGRGADDGAGRHSGGGGASGQQPGGPLRGAAVVVTRPRRQAGPLAAAIERAGGRVVDLPVIETTEPVDGGASLAAAAGRASEYDWIAFTSTNAVHCFLACLRDGRDLGRARLAAVGRATAEALAEHALVADLVADPPQAEALADALSDELSGGAAGVPGEAQVRGPGGGGAGARVLFARAEGGREVLVRRLEARGFSVDQVTAYRTVAAPGPRAELADQVRSAQAVTFSSPSAVAAFAAMRDERGRPLVMPPLVVCGGPVTAAEAVSARDAATLSTTVVEAGGPGAEPMVEALVEALSAALPAGGEGRRGGRAEAP